MKLSQLALSYGFAGRLMLGIIWCLLRGSHVVAAGILHSAVGVMHQARRRLAFRDRFLQRRDRQPRCQRSLQLPAHHFARVGIENHRQVDKLALQPDVGDVGHPKLIDPGQLHPAGQIQIDLQLVIGIRGHHEGSRLHRQQVVLAHDPRHSLVVHQHPAPPQFRR